MNLLSLKNAALATLAAAALCGATSASAARTAEVFNKAVMGSADYGFMGYTDKHGDFVEVTGESILGAWVEAEFMPEKRVDAEHFTMEMLVPVEGSEEVLFTVHSSELIPMGKGKYRASLTSKKFNGVVRAGRYSIETYGTNAQGERIPLNGVLGEVSGFHFLVTRPD